MQLSDRTALVLAVGTIVATMAAGTWYSGKRVDDLRTDVRDDITALRTDMRELRAEVRTDIRDLRAEVRELRVGIGGEIRELRAIIVGGAPAKTVILPEGDKPSSE